VCVPATLNVFNLKNQAVVDLKMVVNFGMELSHLVRVLKEITDLMIEEMTEDMEMTDIIMTEEMTDIIMTEEMIGDTIETTVATGVVEVEFVMISKTKAVVGSGIPADFLMI